MKTRIALLATLLAAGTLSAFGQAYVLFNSLPAYVYNEFTTPGVGTALNPSEIDATFLWAPTTAVDPLGAGQATTGVSVSGGDWFFVHQMISLDGWTVAQNFSTSTEADNDPISTIGGLNYNANTEFELGGATGGDVYQMVVVAWWNDGGTINNVAQAEAADNTIGWSSSFDYTTGVANTSPVDQMSSEGLIRFGVAPIPEPTTLALAGLGGLSMLYFRRRQA